MAYFLKADVKTSIGKTDIVDDDFIDDLIEEVSRDTDRITGRVYEAPALADLGHHAENDVYELTLFLKEWATEIDTVTNGDGVVVAATDYVLTGEGTQNGLPFVEIVLKRGSGLSWTFSESPEEAIVINAKWAFSVTPPEDLKRAMIRKTVYLLLTRKEKLDALPVWVDQIIARYAAPFKVVF